MNKLVPKIQKLIEQHSKQEVLDAISFINDLEVWQGMSSQQKEDFFRAECAKYGLTIFEGTGNPAQCLFVQQFKDIQDPTHPTQPYFMFWRSSNSHKNSGHIEFGHWHMDRKLDKQYPGTEYCYGGIEQQQAMIQKYVNQI